MKKLTTLSLLLCLVANSCREELDNNASVTDSKVTTQTQNLKYDEDYVSKESKLIEENRNLHSTNKSFSKSSKTSAKSAALT